MKLRNYFQTSPLFGNEIKVHVLFDVPSIISLLICVHFAKRCHEETTRRKKLTNFVLNNKFLDKNSDTVKCLMNA